MYVVIDPLVHRYKERLRQKCAGFLFEPDLAFYCWFYSVIQPIDMRYTRCMRKRLHRVFKRDMILLLNGRKSFTGALSTLCVTRKLASPTAWKLFYVRYMKDYMCTRKSFCFDDEKSHGKHNYFGISSFCPRGNRFSLRLLGIDPSFSEYFGMYGARGCYECAYSFTGCISCFAHDQLKPHHYMHLVITGVMKDPHDKCDNKGCNTCLHMTRKKARSLHLEMFGL
jgi:hypothetical protein